MFGWTARDFGRGERNDDVVHYEGEMPARALRLRRASYGEYAMENWADRMSQRPECSGGIHVPASSPGVAWVFHRDVHHGGWESLG